MTSVKAVNKGMRSVLGAGYTSKQESKGAQKVARDSLAQRAHN